MNERIVFIGNTLGPFYLNDPMHAHIDALFDAIAELDIEEAAHEWPFVSDAEAKSSLSLMQQGLAKGYQNDDVVWEYRRLFIGPAKKPAPPWGSVYTDREGVIFGETTLELRQWMREKGITRLGEESSPEDHIGLMLLLMAWIAENKPEDLEEFLSKHFFTWSSHFLDVLISSAEQPFYKGLALLTKQSLEGIQEELELKVEYPHFYR